MTAGLWWKHWEFKREIPSLPNPENAGINPHQIIPQFCNICLCPNTLFHTDFPPYNTYKQDWVEHRYYHFIYLCIKVTIITNSDVHSTKMKINSMCITNFSIHLELLNFKILYFSILCYHKLLKFSIKYLCLAYTLIIRVMNTIRVRTGDTGKGHFHYQVIVPLLMWPCIRVLLCCIALDTQCAYSSVIFINLFFTGDIRTSPFN